MVNFDEMKDKAKQKINELTDSDDDHKEERSANQLKDAKRSMEDRRNSENSI